MRWMAVSLIAFVCAAPVAAQERGARGRRAIALDTVVGVQDFWADAGQWRTQVVFDLASTVEVAGGVQASFRPKLWRVRGEWKTLVDQASIRAEFRRGSNWRLEAGRFASPVGLGLTENRPNLNPGVVWYYRPYYAPLPSLGARAPRMSLVSTVYPYGGQVSTSTGHWDARAAVLDRAPVEFWQQTPGTPRRANVMAGGGITPRQGLRVGVATAAGRLPPAPATAGSGWPYRLLNVEGEFAFARTKVSGEWTRDEFKSPTRSHTATGWTLQGRQTITPRIFAHSRLSAVTAPAAAGTAFVTRTYRSIDTTVGYLVSPDVTVRVGHAALKSYTLTDIDHQFGASLIWTRRWW